MKPLHEMSDGSWISLDHVISITPMPAKPSGGIALPASVVVVHGTGRIEMDFANFSDAAAYARELAAVVNAAREGG